MDGASTGEKIKTAMIVGANLAQSDFALQVG
jgi:hypothetical protein